VRGGVLRVRERGRYNAGATRPRPTQTNCNSPLARAGFAFVSCLPQPSPFLSLSLRYPLSGEFPSVKEREAEVLAKPRLGRCIHKDTTVRENEKS